uniref:Putative secreted protein n=1 Tax=Anopheles triannulatus TaxID=58253 RepID=A0A2M4B7K3_9DIPT
MMMMRLVVVVSRSTAVPIEIGGASSPSYGDPRWRPLSGSVGCSSARSSVLEVGAMVGACIAGTGTRSAVRLV